MTNSHNQHALRALMHEYDLAIQDLISLIHELSNEELNIESPLETKDPDCLTVKTILEHILRSGYGYINTIVKYLRLNTIILQYEFPCSTAHDYSNELIKMSVYTEEKLHLIDDSMIQALEQQHKIRTTWGQYYDIEQLLEHAIVHVLRHRYQIEKYLVNAGN